MNKYLKKFILMFLIFIVFAVGADAKEKIKALAEITQDFSSVNPPKEVSFKLNEKIIIDNRIIHKNSIITAEILEAQEARRWHKSGFIVLNIKDYESLLGYKTDMSDSNIYLIARKYEKVKGKEIAITGTEIVLSQAASFFIPGIDIVYFFTKGAIQRKKNPNRFKAGISNAYENSIFWFWLKGKPIELDENETVMLKETTEKRAYKLKSQIEKRKTRKALKASKKSKKLKEKVEENSNGSEV